MRVSPMAARNAKHSSCSHARSAQRFAIFVKICIAVAPIARPRAGAACVPPAIDTWAPSNTSSSQTGGTQFGSLALSVLALKAGFLVDFFADFFAGVFAGAFFFATVFFAPFF